jgi:hypothetical protein
MNPSAAIGPASTFLAILFAAFLVAACQPGEDRPAADALLAHAPGSPMRIQGGIALVGDFNEDGDPDLVVASSKNVGVWLGNGARNAEAQVRGTPAGTASVPEPASEMAIGDLNGDGNLDVAVANHDSYAVTIVLGDGKGGLALAPAPVVMRDGQQPHTHGLELGDLNGDGKLDVATVNNAHDDVSIMCGDGRGGFSKAPGSPFRVGPSPYPMALGDVNGDGRLDIVTTASATGPQRAQQLPLSRALTLLLAEQAGGFRAIRLPLRTAEPWFAAIADFNGDQKPDIVATHHERRGITLLLGDGQGGFAEAGGSPLDPGYDLFHVAVVDANRDGKKDLFAARGDGVNVMLGDGQGRFAEARHSPYRTGRDTWRLSTGDLNRDGKTDVVTSNQDSVSILLGR